MALPAAVHLCACAFQGSLCLCDCASSVFFVQTWQLLLSWPASNLFLESVLALHYQTDKEGPSPYRSTSRLKADPTTNCVFIQSEESQICSFHKQLFSCVYKRNLYVMEAPLCVQLFKGRCSFIHQLNFSPLWPIADCFTDDEHVCDCVQCVCISQG